MHTTTQIQMHASWLHWGRETIGYTRFWRSNDWASSPALPFPSCAFQRFLRKPYRCCALGDSVKFPDACGDNLMAFDDELRTCWRHTCTASCTRTKHHPAPIMSMMPALDSNRCTCRLGFAIAICNQSKSLQGFEMLAPHRHLYWKKIMEYWTSE